MYQQDGIGAAVADVTAGGQGVLLLDGQALTAVRTHEQPVGATAGCRPIGVILQRRLAAQRRVEPHGSDDDAGAGQ